MVFISPVLLVFCWPEHLWYRTWTLTETAVLKFHRLCLTPDILPGWLFYSPATFLKPHLPWSHHDLISYHSVLENSKVIVLCQLTQRGDVRFDSFWQFLASEMKLVRFIRFMCFTNTKILKLFHDFPQVLHVSCLLSIKYVHHVSSNSC